MEIISHHFISVSLNVLSQAMSSTFIASQAKWRKSRKRMRKNVFTLTIISPLQDLYNAMNVFHKKAAFIRLGRVVFLATSYCYYFECLNHYFARHTRNIKCQMCFLSAVREVTCEAFMNLAIKVTWVI